VEDMSLDHSKWHELEFVWKAGLKPSSFGWKFLVQLNKWGHLLSSCLTVQSISFVTHLLRQVRKTTNSTQH